MKFFYALLANVVLLCSASLGATYYLDASAGNDTTGDGSQASPWQSVAKAMDSVVGGDEVIMAAGNYGSVERNSYNASVDFYDDWVIFKAATGADVEIENLRLAYVGITDPDPTQAGLYDAYLRFEGIHILDGVYCASARHWALVDCLIERYGPWTGSVDNIEKTAVGFRNGTDILIQDCEITNTGTAISGRAHEVRVIGCYLHDCTHDGIRVTSWWDSLIEDTTVCRFNDGVTDGEANWSRHCDLVHIFIPGPGPDGWQNHNVVIRNSRFFDAEAQGFQFNNYYATTETVRNEQILIENCVFGPTNANQINNADPTNGLIIRSCTSVVIPGGRTFDRWTLDNNTWRIGSQSTGVEIYNNLIGNCAPPSTAEVLLFDWNLIQQIPSTDPSATETGRAFGRFVYTGLDPKYVDPTSFTGEIASDSEVADLGTVLNAPTPIYPYGINGVARDNRPDLGAWELPGRSPEVEPMPVSDSATKTIFVDDFEDGSYVDVDPWLEDVATQGMSWSNPESATQYYMLVSRVSEENNVVQSPTNADKMAWLLCNEGYDWADYTFSFTGRNAYVTGLTGVMLLAQDENNYYWLDIGRDTGKLYRVVDGNKTELVSGADIKLPHNGSRDYKVMVSHSETGEIQIVVDADDDGDNELDYTDSDAEAISLFTAGTVGMHTEFPNANLRVLYDDIRAEVSEFASSGPKPGDADLDGDVDIFDFLILKANYGTPAGATWQQGDFDANGAVDIFDFLILKANYGA